MVLVVTADTEAGSNLFFVEPVPIPSTPEGEKCGWS
jgi:hypothetical protein